MAPNQEKKDVKEEENDKPLDKTAEGDKPSGEDSQQKKSDSEQEIDYKTKFSESSKEAQKLLDDKKKLEAELAQTADVMSVLYDNPEQLAEVQKLYDKKYNPTVETDPKATGVVADKVLDRKVQDKLSSTERRIDDLQKQQVEMAVSDFQKQHPDITVGSQEWKNIIEWLPAMKAKGLPIRDGLEKAHQMVSVDKAKETGRIEGLKQIFVKDQAAAGGGSSAGTGGSQPKEAELTSAEKKVADGLGIKHEDYAKNKK